MPRTGGWSSSGATLITTPAQLVAIGDPVAAAVEDPWKNTPRCTGRWPLRSNTSPPPSGIAPFGPRLSCSVRHQRDRLHPDRSDPLLRRRRVRSGRRRAALLWMLNPLMLFELVSGAHIDCLVTLFAVAGVVAVSRSRIARRRPARVVPPRSSCRPRRSWSAGLGPAHGRWRDIAALVWRRRRHAGAGVLDRQRPRPRPVPAGRQARFLGDAVARQASRCSTRPSAARSPVRSCPCRSGDCRCVRRCLLRRESRPAGTDPGGRHEGGGDGRVLVLLRLPAGRALRTPVVRRPGLGTARPDDALGPTTC